MEQEGKEMGREGRERGRNREESREEVWSKDRPSSTYLLSGCIFIRN